MPRNNPLPRARVQRIAFDANYPLGMGSTVNANTRLMRDHGSLCISDGTKRNGGWYDRRLLISDHDEKGNLLPDLHVLSRVFQHADPSTMAELARGYTLAIDAGLISEHDNRTDARRYEIAEKLAEEPSIAELLHEHTTGDASNADVIAAILKHPLVKAITNG